MKYGLDEMSPTIEDDNNTSRRSSTSSEDSFEIVSAETCESPKNEMSFIPSVTFSEMFDIYPMDSDVIARISCDDNFQSTIDDIVIVLPMSWATVEQAICVSKVVDGYVKFDVNVLPKNERCCYQLCYCATVRKTVVGVSIPFSFREVREEELMDSQKESNNEFYTFRSRFAILMDIHWNTLLRAKNHVPLTGTEKTTNSSHSSFVDVQESIRVANNESFVSNCTGPTASVNLLELSADSSEERTIDGVHHDDSSKDESMSLERMVLTASIETNAIDNSIEMQKPAVNEDIQNSLSHPPVLHSQLENNILPLEIEQDGECKNSSNTTSVNTDEFDFFGELENMSSAFESVKISGGAKKSTNIETTKLSLIEIPEMNEMYCSAKDFQEFENANNQVIQNDGQKPTDGVGIDVDLQIKDFMTEVTRLIETDYVYHQMNKYQEKLEHYYKQQLESYKLKEEASHRKEEELACKLVNITIEKQNLLQSYVEYKISSENRLKEAAKEYVKLYLKWKKSLRRSEL